MLQYKLVIDANGDCKNSQRFSKLLLAETLVLKSSGHSSTFLTRLVEPWKQYVPFDENADDLAYLVRKLLLKPMLAEKIVKSAVEKVSEVLSPHGMVCYMRELILAYGELMKFRPVRTRKDVHVTIHDSQKSINSTSISLRGLPAVNYSNFHYTQCEITEVNMPP
mgnify:FL=1